jgi:hypothetical protein
MKIPFRLRILGLAFMAGILSLLSCNHQKTRYQEASLEDIPLKHLQIKRYEKELFSLAPDSLPTQIQQLKGHYDFFLGKQPEAPVNLARLKAYLEDPLIIEVYQSVDSAFGNLTSLEKRLSVLFRNLRYYYPKSPQPQIYTYISGIDYQHPVQYFDSVAIIALDMYLGAEYQAYKKLNIPGYITQYYHSEQIPFDMANAIAESKLPSNLPQKTLLDHIIREGKKLYFKDALLPEAADQKKIKYTEAQIRWCQKHEKDIWAFIIENDLLFSGNYEQYRKLISPGPFSSDFGRNSAPHIGHWVGWQIVREFMENQKDTSLEELMRLKNNQKILQQSGYKP